MRKLPEARSAPLLAKLGPGYLISAWRSLKWQLKLPFCVKSASQVETRLFSQNWSLDVHRGHLFHSLDSGWYTIHSIRDEVWLNTKSCMRLTFYPCKHSCVETASRSMWPQKILDDYRHCFSVIHVSLPTWLNLAYAIWYFRLFETQ